MTFRASLIIPGVAQEEAGVQGSVSWDGVVRLSSSKSFT